MKKARTGINILLIVCLSLFSACNKTARPEPGIYIDGQMKYSWQYALENDWFIEDQGTVLYNENYTNVNRYIKGDLVIGDDVNTIGEKAFDGRYQIASVTLPKNLMKLEKGALGGMMNISEFVIPQYVKEIPDNCFSGDEKLKNVYLPKSVNKIGSSAFADCKRFFCITYGGTKRRWGHVNIAEDALKDSNVICAECSDGRVYINKTLAQAPEAIRNCVVWSYENYGGFSNINRLSEAETLTVGEYIRGKQSIEDFRMSYVIGGRSKKNIKHVQLKYIKEEDLIVMFPTVRFNHDDYDIFLCDCKTKKVVGMFVPSDY